jgi:peptidoglycan hydrolase FlgJ
MDGIKGLTKAAGLLQASKAEKPLPLTKDAKAASEQFEALLVQEMLKSMWSTVPQTGMLSGSYEEGMYRDMLNEAIAKSISEGQGMGIKDVIYKDINKVDKNK